MLPDPGRPSYPDSFRNPSTHKELNKSKPRRRYEKKIAKRLSPTEVKVPNPSKLEFNKKNTASLSEHVRMIVLEKDWEKQKEYALIVKLNKAAQEALLLFEQKRDEAQKAIEVVNSLLNEKEGFEHLKVKYFLKELKDTVSEKKLKKLIKVKNYQTFADEYDKLIQANLIFYENAQNALKKDLIGIKQKIIRIWKRNVRKAELFASEGFSRNQINAKRPSGSTRFHQTKSTYISRRSRSSGSSRKKISSVTTLSESDQIEKKIIQNLESLKKNPLIKIVDLEGSSPTSKLFQAQLNRLTKGSEKNIDNIVDLLLNYSMQLSRAVFSLHTLQKVKHVDDEGRKIELNTPQLELILDYSNHLYLWASLIILSTPDNTQRHKRAKVLWKIAQKLKTRTIQVGKSSRAGDMLSWFYIMNAITGSPIKRTLNYEKFPNKMRASLVNFSDYEGKELDASEKKMLNMLETALVPVYSTLTKRITTSADTPLEYQASQVSGIVLRLRKSCIFSMRAELPLCKDPSLRDLFRVPEYDGPIEDTLFSHSYEIKPYGTAL